MIITEQFNNVADGLTGFTAAATALGVAILGWLKFWEKAARLVPTEWDNKTARYICKTLNMFCRIMALDWPNIARIQFSPFRIITHSELTATQVVNAAVIPLATIPNPPPPAAPAVIGGVIC